MELGALICLPKWPRCSSCPLLLVCPSRRRLPSTSRLKPAPTIQREYILLPKRNGKVWLTQTHPQGRWQGLHLLPTLFHRPSGPPGMEVRYPFTRYWVHAAVFVTNRPPRNLPGRWMTAVEVRHATLPAPHRKILGQLGIG